ENRLLKTPGYFISISHTLLSVVVTPNASSRPSGEGRGLANQRPVSWRSKVTAPFSATCKRSPPSRREVVTKRLLPSAAHEREFVDVHSFSGTTCDARSFNESIVI